MKGRIIKGIGGFYYVNDDAGNTHECRACGRFRKENIKPLVGDYVEFATQQGQEYGFVEQISPRENELMRPAVSNIDCMMIVLSASVPHVDYMLCDKLLIQAYLAGIPPVVCVNKSEKDQKTMQAVRQQYAAYDVLCVSAHTGEGIRELKEAIRGKCVCFAGQSAVGKSSLINVIGESMHLEVGGLSKKTARGKHTTRTTELLYLPALDAYVFDTPGFSMFDLNDVPKEEIACAYREFAQYADECRFALCAHYAEPDCMVKKAVESGAIDQRRYERYLRILDSIQ